MTWANKQHVERLYLDREGPEDVYVDIGPLPQHQIDGIRFLFRQFKKKKPGVILNNPDGYGKTFQVTLFLETIRKVLDHPILIICENDRAVENWMQNLKTGTQYKEDDIVIDSPHVYVKKLIFLKKGTHLPPPYVRRDWGVVVVKNDFMPKELMRAQMRAAYRIWMTTVDMRKDLQMFNVIYSWMYSEKKFNVESFLDSIPNSTKPLNRMKLLNAFMDEVVIMRNEFQPIKSEATHETFNMTPKVSRKNKDATGKKIKRTKKKVDDASASAPDNTSANASLNSNSTVTSTNAYEKKTEESLSEHNIHSNDKKRDIETEKSDCKETANKDEMDVESFIREKKPIECEEYEDMNEDICTEVDSKAFSFNEAVRDIVKSESDAVIKDEGNDISVSNSVNNDAAEEFIQVDGKLSNLNVSSDDINKEQTAGNNETPISLNVASDENKQVIVEEHNNNACKENEMENGGNDKAETEHQEKEINKRNLDQKISEMEEKAVKKFKGSLLDSFF